MSAPDRPVRRGRDPHDLLADLLDQVGGVQRRLRRTARYRSDLLWVHTAAALLIAPLMAATGQDGMTGPAWTLTRQLPGAPVSLAALIGVAGFVLGCGQILADRRVQAAGLILLAVFYAVLAVSFAGAVILWDTGRLAPKPALYTPVLYVHLTVIMLVHIAGRLRPRRQDGAPG